MTWTQREDAYRLAQCDCDSQVWTVMKRAASKQQNKFVKESFVEVGGKKTTQAHEASASGSGSTTAARGENIEEMVRLLICYVDDMLLLVNETLTKENLMKQMAKLWKMSTDARLTSGQTFGFFWG